MRLLLLVARGTGARHLCCPSCIPGPGRLGMHVRHEPLIAARGLPLQRLDQPPRRRRLLKLELSKAAVVVVVICRCRSRIGAFERALVGSRLWPQRGAAP